MVVVDSSGPIPLAWVGRLDPIPTVFDDIRTTEDVREEVLTEGKPGTAALEEFLTDVAVHDTPARTDEVASMEGIAVADASVILLAEHDGVILLANDKGLIEVARSHGVECWWVTTLLLKCTKDGDLTEDEASDVLSGDAPGLGSGRKNSGTRKRIVIGKLPFSIDGRRNREATRV